MSLATESFPVGKVDTVHLTPLSFAEFLAGIGEQSLASALIGIEPDRGVGDYVHGQLWEQLKMYFIVGGLPEVVQTYAEHRANMLVALEKVRQLQNSLIASYYRDMAKHAGKINALHIERVFANVPAQLAREIKSTPDKYVFKDVLPSDSRYAKLAGPIDWLVKAGLIFKVPITCQAKQPLSAYTQENLFKLYVFDVGILGALSGLMPQVIRNYDYGSYKGYFAENYVAQEFVCAGVRQLYAWNENTAEIEFVREAGDAIIPVEVKAGNQTRAKSLQVFARKYQPPKQIVLSARNVTIDQGLKKYNCPLYVSGRIPLVGGW